MMEVKGLSKKFNDFVAISDVSFIVKDNEVHGLIGHNGAGKTTTLRIILGLLRPDAGYVSINGLNVTERPEEIWKISGYVAEEEGYYDYLTAFEYLKLFAKFYGIRGKEAERRINDLCRLLGIEHYANRKILSYSRGMRRILSIARALLHDPKILILDEPTSGLSPEIANNVRNIIHKLANCFANKIVILSSHNLWEVEKLCKNITVLWKGRVIFNGSLERLKEVVNVKPIFKIKLMENVDQKVINIIESYLDNKILSINGRECKFECDESIISQLMMEFSEAGIRVVSLNEERATLNDIYMKLVGEIHNGA